MGSTRRSVRARAGRKARTAFAYEYDLDAISNATAPGTVLQSGFYQVVGSVKINAKDDPGQSALRFAPGATVTISTTYPLSIFPECEQRRIAADLGTPRLPPAVKRAIAGSEKAMARSRRRAEKGFCTKEESEALCAKSAAALRAYLDKQVEFGAITPAGRKAVGR